MSTEEQTSYQQIFKSTGLFGGVQVVSILTSIVRMKFIAVLLGPAGIGIQGLLSSSTGFIAYLTNFGLGTSAVKNVAEANSIGDNHRISVIIAVLRKWVWITGLLGAIITMGLSPWLSEITFGNRDYTLAFIWISVTLLFNQLSSGEMVVLQGMRKLKYLASANLSGAILGLLVSVPLYYYFTFDGIVPSIICSSLFSLVLSWYFGRKVKVKKVHVTKLSTISEGKGMLKMGLVLSLSGLITVGASYIVRIYISNTGSIDDVGLYNAGFAIVTTYVGLVFTAMATDYYPRLSGVSHDNKQSKILINQQAEIAILILGPILTVFLIFINWIIILLYSSKFVAINGMIYYAAIGMYFKAVSWAIAFIIVAKGDSKLFFWNELLGNLYMFSFNILGYYLYGLNGLGISFLLGYVVYLFHFYLISKIRYKFSFTREFFKIFIPQLSFGILCFFCIKFVTAPWIYIIGVPLIGLSALYSFYEMNKRLGLKAIFLNRINSIRKR